MIQKNRQHKLWFDVGIERYTAVGELAANVQQLWFDVGIERYTAGKRLSSHEITLWFDVGIERYTAVNAEVLTAAGCGLM